MLPASKTTFLILTQFATHSYQDTFFRGQKSTTPHHISWIGSNCMLSCGFFRTLAAYLRLYGFNLITSKISAWRQGNTVTNCNNSRPMEPCGFMILDVTLRFVFVFFWFTRTEADNWDMDFKNRMLRPFIWCVQRDYTLFMPYGVNLFFKRHGAILKNAALR